MKEHKQIFQIADALRGSMRVEDSLSTAIQLLALTKVSACRSVERDLFNAETVVVGSGPLLDNPANWEAASGTEGLAFAGLYKFSQDDPVGFRAALDICQKMQSKGILDSFDATDIATLAYQPQSGEWAIPPEVADLMVGLAGPVSGDTVYAPWDAGIQLGGRVTKCDASAYIDIPIFKPLTAAIALLQGGSVYLNCSDPVRNPSAVESGKLKKFTSAISVPPFNQKYPPGTADSDWYGRFPEKEASGNVLAIRHLLAQSERKVVVAITNSLLFSQGSEQSLRKDLLMRGFVEAVIAMPSGLFANTNISFSIIVLDSRAGHSRVRFVNADTEDYREPISKAKSRLKNVVHLIDLVNSDNDSVNAVSIRSSDLVTNDAQLQVSRYVLPDSKKAALSMIRERTLCSLDSIATTHRPILSYSGDGETIQAHEIGMGDIPQFGFIKSPGRILQIDATSKTKSAHLFLRPFDIILVVKGNVGKVGIMPPSVAAPGSGGWVAGQSAIVIRVKNQKDFDPRALLVLLRSSLGQELLKGIVVGASMPLIQIRELMMLEIPVPTPEEAARAISSLEQEARLQEEIDALISKQAEQTNGLWKV